MSGGLSIGDWPERVTNKPTDAVAQARDEYDYAREAWRSRPSEVTWQRVQQAWAEVLAAVRAECAAKVPPTPDLDAVREALVALAQSADWVAIDRLASALGVQETPATRFVGEAIADALLAAVSRPAEARGEPSEAMVEAYRDADMCADSLLDTHTAHWCPKCITNGLRAALAAQRQEG